MSKSVPLKNSIGKMFPEIAAELHPTMNGDLNASTIKFGSGKMRWWTCRFCKQDFEMTPNQRTNMKMGCRCRASLDAKYEARMKEREAETGIEIKSTGGATLATACPDFTKEWDYEANSPVTPDTVSYKSFEKFNWVCQKGHKFVASPLYRNQYKSKCPVCRKADTGLVEKRQRKIEIYQELEREYDPSLNNWRAYSSFGFSSNIQINWKCENGHIFTNNLNKRTGSPRRQALPCPHCVVEVNKKSVPEAKAAMICDTESQISDEFNEKLNKQDGRTIFNTATDCRAEVWWDCSVSKSHLFSASPYDRFTNGVGCVFCEKKKLKLEAGKI